MVKLLRLREDAQNREIKDEIETYYIHFHNQNHPPTELLASKMGNNFTYSNQELRSQIYDEICSKYLSEEKQFEYDPIMVIAGIRLKIEELVFNMLDSNNQDDFITLHTVIKKLEYAENLGIDIPELFYLLQPLYNDGLHLRGDDNTIQQKIKSCYLKIDNLHIKQMIKRLFSE